MRENYYIEVFHLYLDIAVFVDSKLSYISQSCRTHNQMFIV